MLIKEVLDKTVKFFKEKGFDSPRLDAELLLAYALKIERIQLYLKFEQPLKEEELAIARDLVKRHVQGEPVAYILGEKGFFGHIFKVGPGVLIPRPETEHLVEEAIEWMKKNPMDQFAVVDLGCGSGCIGLSVLKSNPHAFLFAVDISETALNFSKANAEKLGVSAQCKFILADAEDAEQILTEMKHEGFEKINLLLSNPPYIGEDDPLVQRSVKDFEPAEALFAPEQGLAKLRSWSKLYMPFLSEPGLMLMEMGYQQGPEMKKHFNSLNFKSVEIRKDLSGHDRVIKGEIHG
jgi:release factor glutamine methyltransferase